MVLKWMYPDIPVIHDTPVAKMAFVNDINAQLLLSKHHVDADVMTSCLINFTIFPSFCKEIILGLIRKGVELTNIDDKIMMILHTRDAEIINSAFDYMSLDKKKEALHLTLQYDHNSDQRGKKSTGVVFFLTRRGVKLDDMATQIYYATRKTNPNVLKLTLKMMSADEKEATLYKILESQQINEREKIAAMCLIANGVNVGYMYLIAKTCDCDIIKLACENKLKAMQKKKFDQFSAIIQYLPACIGKDLTYMVFSLPTMHDAFDVSDQIKKNGLIFKWL